MWIAGGAAAGAVGNIFSSIFGASSAKQQAGAIRDAANIASQTALTINNRTRADLQPFRDVGSSAAQQFSDLLSGKADLSGLIQASVPYQFAQTMGTRDINRQLAARGQYNSGAGLETLAKFNADIESQIGRDYMGQVFNLASLGENAAAQTGQAATAAAGQVAQAQTAGAANAADASLTGTKYLTSGASGAFGSVASGLQSYGQYQFYKPILDQISNRSDLSNGGPKTYDASTGFFN
jgi:hypothetical protein